MAWLSGWAKRLKIAVDADVIDAALSGFPVPVYISAASGIGDVDASCVFDELASDANRKKIAVTTDDGVTQCYVEIQRWDDANEKAWLHVKLTSISESADTDLYLYYDSSQADNTTYVGDTGDAAAQAVWDSNFVGVYHMEQDPNGDPASGLKDSTATGAHLSVSGSMTSSDLVDGPFGKAIDFDGSNDRGSSGTVVPSGLTAATIEAHLYPTVYGSLPDWRNAARMGNPAAGQEMALTEYYHSGKWNVGIYADDLQGPSITSQWMHIATKVQSNVAYLVINGVQDSITNAVSLNTGSGTISVGGKMDAASYFGAIFSEVRFSRIGRSTAWLKATYHGLFDSLLVFGIEEVLAIEADFTDAAALGDTLDALRLAEVLTDGAGLGDTIDGYYLRETITDAMGMGATFDPLHLVETITDGAGLSDTLAREIEAALSIADGAGLGDDILAYDLRAEITDGAGMGDSLAREVEYCQVVTDSAGLGDSFSCLNWSEWLRLNSGQALKRFYFTLTGDGETPAVADAVIPISSFQARLRQGEPTYLSVVIPDLDAYSAIVSARSHGEMVIEMALLLDGVEAVREEICRVDLEDINIYEGARNKSISLSGHATETYATKITALTGASYYNLSGGLRRYRCAMDPYLKPGDTVRVNSEEFEVGYITISRSVGSETMEVVEAES